MKMTKNNKFNKFNKFNKLKAKTELHAEKMCNLCLGVYMKCKAWGKDLGKETYQEKPIHHKLANITYKAWVQ
jgi:hypothetical protein